MVQIAIGFWLHESLQYVVWHLLSHNHSLYTVGSAANLITVIIILGVPSSHLKIELIIYIYIYVCPPHLWVPLTRLRTISTHAWELLRQSTSSTLSVFRGESRSPVLGVYAAFQLLKMTPFIVPQWHCRLCGQKRIYWALILLSYGLSKVSYIQWRVTFWWIKLIGRHYYVWSMLELFNYHFYYKYYYCPTQRCYWNNII